MNVLIIDTETANCFENPLPYDIGYNIINVETEEILLRRSFVVAEIFLDEEMMSSAYYAEKCPQYWRDLKSGRRKMARMTTVRRIICQDMKKYDVTLVGGYNMKFDKGSCRNGIRFITCSSIRWFFPARTEFFDIWHMACSSILRSKYYLKWAIKNGQVSEAGNVLTSAEAAYRYIIKNPDFEESHTGLEDVDIETAIYFKVLKSRMKYESHIVNNPWRIPNKRKKELGW